MNSFNEMFKRHVASAGFQSAWPSKQQSEMHQPCIFSRGAPQPPDPPSHIRPASEKPHKVWLDTSRGSENPNPQDVHRKSFQVVQVGAGTDTSITKFRHSGSSTVRPFRACANYNLEYIISAWS